MEMIELTDDLFLGNGAHKAVYIDPRDRKKCVKILFQEPDIDWEREQKYRKSRKRRHLSSLLLPTYYGTVATNRGTGYIFERVMDFDGCPSLDIGEFLRKMQKESVQGQALALIEKVLSNFKTDFFREKIITTNMQYENFLIQQRQPDFTDFTVRIIDNIGTHSKVPLLFYVDFLAMDHVKRYWKRFIRDIQGDFPELMPVDLEKKLIV